MTTCGASSFFWSLACLCHDVGYAYEIEDGHRAGRGKMLTAEGCRELLKIENDLLELKSDQLNKVSLKKAERRWAKRSLDLVKRYNAYSVNGHFTTIGHGIAVGLILFDCAMRIAQPKPHTERRAPAAAALEALLVWQMEANRRHSRFAACCLMIALTVARHNVWITRADRPDDVREYKAFNRLDQIVNDEAQLIDHMDTIDPDKLFHSRSPDDIYIRCDRKKTGNTYLKCTLKNKTPMADYEAIFGDSYAFVEAAEVLLPPFLALRIRRMNLPDITR